MKSTTQDLVDMSRVYLLDNFHKFKDSNKIKIALALIQKSMPNKIEGNLTVNLSQDLGEARNRINSYNRIPITH
jgi:hypothetical protein